MNVNPGKLDKKIKIIQKTQTINEDGFATSSETIVRECWASFKRTTGTEIVKNGNADFSQVNARFLVRFSQNINEKMIIRYANTDYNIIFLNNYNDSNEYIEIWVKKVS